MTGCSSNGGGGGGATAAPEAAAASGELNDLRLAFADIAGYHKTVGLRSVLKLKEVKAQIAEGDLHVEDLESAWLEACAVKGVLAVDPKDHNDGANYHIHQRASWGVCTELPFEGFVHFLALCEGKARLPPGVATATEAPPKDDKTGCDLLAARHRMIGLLRATLTVHQRGGGGEEEESDHVKDSNSQLGETLHLSMVRAAVEEGLEHHNPETLLELMRTGIYKESEEEANLDLEEKKAALRRGLLGRKYSRKELLQSGILQEKTPGQLAGERAHAAGRVLRRLQLRSAGSAQDLLAAGAAAARSAAATKTRHHHRPSVDDLMAQRIYRTPEQLEVDERQHELARAFLQQELGHRAHLSDLKERGIYVTPETESKQRLEKAMLADLLSKSFRERPYREDLMDRGVLEASQLKNVFHDIQKEGPIKTVDDVLQRWPIVANAVKEGVVGVPALTEAFSAAMGEKVPDGGGDSNGGGGDQPQQMSYEDFDRFLSSAKTTQVEDEPYSLKLWVLMQMRPDLEDQEHREGNSRRNALMAQELEQELGKREPLERLANKGIYVDKTPQEGAVERAHLKHTLAHGLAHRPELAELSHKGVYLEASQRGPCCRPCGVEPDDLEKSHRDARNYLEGTLSRRPTLDALQEKGYLEADELEEAFTELILEYKHDHAPAAATTASSDDGGECGSTQLLLPADRLTTWAPVQKMLRSGVAMEEDVAAASAKAQKASFHHRHHKDKSCDGSGGDDAASSQMVDFVGFLEFIHGLDLEVDGLGASSSGKTDDHDDNDPEAAARHARRLQRRRERAAHAAEEDSYGTLKEHLVAHLRSRPGKNDPETQRIAKEFHSTEAVNLEKNLLKNRLEGHLRAVSGETPASFGSSIRGGVGRNGDQPPLTAARKKVKELELAMNKRMLKHSVTASAAGSSNGGDSTARAVVVPGPRLNMEAKRDIIEDSLEGRSSVDDLANQGIYQRVTPLQHDLDRHLVEQRLSKALGNPMRPSKKDLVDHGIYIDATPRELQMEHYLAGRNLKHGLEGRETLQDLKDHGVYQPENSVRAAAHEKLLIKALLQRKLSHAFSREELDRLRQKGVYKEDEHDKLDAERLLVTRQLARLVSKRPDPAQLEREHPGLMQAGTLALVFEERVMPRASATGGGDGSGGGGVGGGVGYEEADAETKGGPEHLVSFEGLMTWPDVQEHLAGAGDDTKHEMARHFDLCDSDGDGFITFSQFLRWVELCDLNPEDHLQVTDADLEAEYSRQGETGEEGITLDQAMGSPLLKRWAVSASLDLDALNTMWRGEGDEEEGSSKKMEEFKAFCRHCESRSSAAHQMRLKDLQNDASAAEAKSKADLRAKLAAKLSARPDLEELKKTSIYRAGGLNPAMIHLERNLISIGLKEQLLARPAVEDLENRGIKPKEGTQTQLQHNSSKLREALDSTMQHDDAQWRSHPSLLAGGSREEVSALLQKSLSKRLSFDQLTNKGIYVVDTDASYALLVHQVLRAHRAFELSSAQLVASL
ncbi:unnamed protein product [Scytosiphon promiscuus]